jgi:hypothetical protein
MSELGDTRLSVRIGLYGGYLVLLKTVCVVGCI